MEQNFIPGFALIGLSGTGSYALCNTKIVTSFRENKQIPPRLFVLANIITCLPSGIPRVIASKAFAKMAGSVNKVHWKE